LNGSATMTEGRPKAGSRPSKDMTLQNITDISYPTVLHKKTGYTWCIGVWISSTYGNIM